jgi:serine/threonine-protein kinase
MSEEITARVADYEVLGVLGTGGMGRVYKVRNVISDRVEAMKILLPNLAASQDLAERFLREIKVLATLDHPNIAALRTALTVNNQLIMIMEYVEGVTLAQRLEQGALPTAEALDDVDQVLAALSYAHGRGVIHRDIKPSNMMVTPQGVVKLMDFGIARSERNPGLTSTGATLGSIYYMSPEQVQGALTDARSDLYSLGVSLYEMITGQRPFQADSDYAILAAHMQQGPKPPIDVRAGLAKGLNDLILKAMEKNPGDRLQSADAFRSALNSIRSSPSTSAATQDMAAVSAPVVAPPAATTPQPATSFFDNESAAPGSSPAASAASVVQTPLPPVGNYRTEFSSSPNASHRGLYMALGALVVLVALVAAGLYVPRRMKARAAQDSGVVAPPRTSAQNSPAAPVEVPPLAPEQNVAANPSPAIPVADSSVTMKPAPTPSSPAVIPSASTHTPHHSNPKTPAESQSGGVRHTLQRQQAAQGLNLRGDIAASRERLHAYTTKAQAAMQNQDAKNTQKYLSLAQSELETIEKFLGH